MLVSILSLFYITGLVLKWMHSQSLFQRCFKKCFSNNYCQLWHTKDQLKDSDFSESLPHPIDHANDNEPLLINTSTRNVNLSQYGTVEHMDKTAY